MTLLFLCGLVSSVAFLLGLRIGALYGKATADGIGDADEYKVGGTD